MMRAVGREMSRGFAFAESERIDRRAPACCRSRYVRDQASCHSIFSRRLAGRTSIARWRCGSYQDYRFRAPNLLLLQENFEHSIWGPFGVKFMADQGRVALTRGESGFSHLRHSFAAG